MPLAHKVIELYKTFHEFLKLFPRTEKYSLGQKIENLVLEILELIFKIIHLPKQEKLTALKEIDTKTTLLKTLMRLANEIAALDNKKYLILQEKLQEVGKMTGGWIKYLMS